MAVEIVTREDLEKFRLQLLEDIKSLLQPAQNVAEKKWLRTPDVLEMLDISLSTLQNLCYKRILHPKKIGGINYYSANEIENVLNHQHDE
jgi:hypothetical protein